MKLLEREPTYLLIRWEAAQPGEGGLITFEASLCRSHREEFFSNPTARGSGQLGHSCDLCRGRGPRKVSDASSIPKEHSALPIEDARIEQMKIAGIVLGPGPPALTDVHRDGS